VRCLYSSFFKKNELYSLFFAGRGERDRGIKKTTKKIKNDVVYLFFFFLDELVLFYNEFIILGPYFGGLKFLWEKFLSLI
jgi:hypothetical protein